MRTPGLSVLAVIPFAEDIVDAEDVQWLIGVKADGTQVFAEVAGLTTDITDLCAAIAALNTTDDTEVPLTADIPYRNAGGVCKRAPLPKLRGFITTRALAVDGALAPATDEVLLLDTTAGPIALSLVAPTSGQNRNFILKKTNAGSDEVTATPTSGTIDGETELVFGEDEKTAIEIMWDGTNWHIVSAS